MNKLILFLLSFYSVFCINDSLALVSEPPTWQIKFTVNSLNITMTKKQSVGLTISNLPVDLPATSALQVLPERTDLLHINLVIPMRDIDKTRNEWKGNVTMEGLFLGKTNVYVVLLQDDQAPQRAKGKLTVIILRNVNGLDTAFKMVVGAFVMVLYINFGAAVDLKALKGILLKPVGPSIGLSTKFLIMPVVGFYIGKYMFGDQTDLRLGLFFTAVTPPGGSSNIFTTLLDGNLNLSVSMTALSNLLAFIMMPIWIFTLGAVIFNEAHFVIPYMAIATTSCSLVLPLMVGICLQKYKPEYVSGLVRYLKTFSLILITSIMIFSCYVNSFMFKLFTVKILLAGALLSWCGYLLGYFVAKLLRQSHKDALTIAIETGIENTGIAIFMLNFTLPQPTADITSAIPVANSMMTLLPLVIMLSINSCKKRCFQTETKEAVQFTLTPQTDVVETDTEIKAIMK